mmetsp:Transcript_23802/g.62716  ORF Transcript_23802/g.62716 Transcript_23802/m.62716 type:complete len:435 (+) Transcript_23802:38-1342(+)
MFTERPPEAARQGGGSCPRSCPDADQGHGGAARLRRLGLVVGAREADPAVGVVEDRVELAHEGVAQDQRRALPGAVGAPHQEPAPVLVLLEVLGLVQLEGLAVDHEADRGRVLRALVVELELRHHRPEGVPRVHHQRGAGVHGGVAALLAAEVRGLPADSDVHHVDLPGAVVHDGGPRELRGHAALAVGAKGELPAADLVLRAGRQVQGEQVRAGFAPEERVQDVELLRVRAARGQAEHAVERQLAEGLVGLLGRRHEVAVRADAADADRVLNEDPADLSGAKGDGHHVAIAALVDRFVRAVREGHVHRARGQRGVEALVGLAGLVLALLGREEQVAAARVEDDDEVLRRRPDRDLAVVLASVRLLAGRASSSALRASASGPAQAQRRLRPRLDEGGGLTSLQLHRVCPGGGSRFVRGGGQHVAGGQPAGDRQA